MKVNQTVQLPNGNVKFEGELSQEEADAVVGAGLTMFLMAGILPVTEKEGGGFVVDGPETVQ